MQLCHGNNLGKGFCTSTRAFGTCAEPIPEIVPMAKLDIWKSFLMISNLSIYGNVFETSVFQKMALFSLWLFRLSCPSVPLSLLFWTKNCFVCIHGQYKFSIEFFFFKRASKYFYDCSYLDHTSFLLISPKIPPPPPPQKKE